MLWTVSSRTWVSSRTPWGVSGGVGTGLCSVRCGGDTKGMCGDQHCIVGGAGAGTQEDASVPCLCFWERACRGAGMWER